MDTALDTTESQLVCLAVCARNSAPSFVSNALLELGAQHTFAMSNICYTDF